MVAFAKSERRFLVLRYLPLSDNKYKPMLIAMSRDGDDICLAIPASEWADKGGNHPNWCSDGEHVFMNLDIERKGWRFVQAKYDGTGMKKMAALPASQGHPSLHPSGELLIDNAYPTEPAAFGDGSAPLWLIDLGKNQRQTLVRIRAATPLFDKDPDKTQEMRVDLHPARDSHTHTHVAINMRRTAISVSSGKWVSLSLPMSSM